MAVFLQFLVKSTKYLTLRDRRSKMLMMYRTVKQIEEVKFIEDLSSDDAKKIENEILLIIRRGLAKLVIDLSELQSIDQTGLELIEKCAKLARLRSGWLVLINPSQKIRTLVKEKYSLSIFPIHFSSQSAIDAMCN